MAFRDSPLVPFVVVTRRNRACVALDKLPPGLPEPHIADPQRVEHADFVRLIQRMDDLTFGPIGLEMPGWVFYDCGAMPGIIFGLGMPAPQVRPWLKRVLRVPEDYEGLVPLTLFIAIATVRPEAWLVYSLTGMNLVAPGATREGAIRETFGAGLALLPAKTLYATLQWRSRVFADFTALGPLEVLTAWTPAHDILATLTCRVDVPEDASSILLGSVAEIHPAAPAPNRAIDVDRPEDLQELQSFVESGQRAWVVAPPTMVGRYTVGLIRTGELGEAAEVMPT